MGVLDIVKRILGEEEADDFSRELSISDGCVGEIEKAIEKLKRLLKPC